jgi:hypothetical protein
MLYLLIALIIYARLLIILRTIWQAEDEKRIQTLSVLTSIGLTIYIFVMELIEFISWSISTICYTCLYLVSYSRST